MIVPIVIVIYRGNRTVVGSGAEGVALCLATVVTGNPAKVCFDFPTKISMRCRSRCRLRVIAVSSLVGCFPRFVSAGFVL